MINTDVQPPAIAGSLSARSLKSEDIVGLTPYKDDNRSVQMMQVCYDIGTIATNSYVYIFKPSEYENISRISNCLRALKSTIEIKPTLALLNRIREKEAELLTKYAYSFSKLVVNIMERLTVPVECGVIDSTGVHRSPKDLPEGTKAFLDKAGYKDFVSQNVENIFFIPDGEKYLHIFPLKGDQLGSMEYFTRSVFINSGCGALSPIEQAATIVHEACHINTFPKFRLAYTGEKEAFTTELKYWEKLSEMKAVLSEKDRLVIDKNIEDIRVRLATGHFL